VTQIISSTITTIATAQTITITTVYSTKRRFIIPIELGPSQTRGGVGKGTAGKEL
jgi:hypothetical protein